MLKQLNLRTKIPSAITLGNLFCGFLAIAYVADERLMPAAWLIFAGMIFDVLDGKVARLVKGSTDFGVQLDSLADMITFGVAPAFIAKVYLSGTPACAEPRVVWAMTLIFVLCAALRLARFNVTTNHDESSHKYFQGLATPAAAGVIASLVLLSDMVTPVVGLMSYKTFMLALTCILAALMVSSFRYLHLGVRLLKKNHIMPKALFLLGVVTAIIWEPQILIVLLATVFCGYAAFAPLYTICHFLFSSQQMLTSQASVKTQELAELLSNDGRDIKTSLN